MPINFMGRNVGFEAPDADRQLEIQRRLAMSQMLQQQGMEPIQEQKVPGGWAVPIHPLQGAAKLAQAYVGAKAGGRAQELAKQLQGDQQARRGADIGMLVQALQGRPAQPAGLAEDAAGNVTPTDQRAAQTPSQGLQQALPMMQDPAIQQAALQAFMAQQQRENAPPQRVDLGDKIGLINQQGQIVGYLPKGATPDAALRETGTQQRHLTPSGSAQLGSQTTLQTHATPSGSALLTDARARSEGALGRGQALTIAQMVDQSAREAAALKGPPSTPGQTATDKEFAKEYVAFKASGGIADVKKQLVQLSEAAAELEINPSLTGPWRGLFPDKTRAITNPQAVATKEAVQEVAQRNLRLVLGAQFTEKEGERLIARVYNDQLEPAENAKRVRRLITQIGEAAQAKQSASEYFEKNGTLTGWNGKLYTLSDFMPKDRGTDAGKPEGVDDLLNKYPPRGGR